MQQFPVFFFHHKASFSTFSFFDIGKGKEYDSVGKKRTAFGQQYDNHYQLLLKQLIKVAEKDGLKCGVSFSGTFLALWNEKDPGLLKKFAKLVDSNAVSLIACGYHGSISSLLPDVIWEEELHQLRQQYQACFGLQPSYFANPYLIYNDQVAEQLTAAGFEACLTVAMPWHLNGRSSRQLFLAANKKLKLVLHKFDRPDMSNENLIMPYFSMNEQAGEAWEYLKQIGNKKSTTLSLAELLSSNKATESYRVPRAIGNKINEINLSVLAENPLQRAILNRLAKMSESAAIDDQTDFLKEISAFYAVEQLELLNIGLYPPSDDPYFYYLNLGNILTDLELRMKNING